MSLKMTVMGLVGLLMIVFPYVSAQGCVYNGRKYHKGETISDICIDITCVYGQWTTTGTYNGKCGFCSLNDDPHIQTFDQYYYDWHGTCNYSISQLNFGFYEKFGIYGQFQQCGGASCVHLTTFTDNPHTVIEINHWLPGTVTVNGNPYTVQSFIDGIPAPNQPVLAWNSNGCDMFLGSQGLLLQTCPNQIFVWAHPNLVNQVNGLCGHFNFDPSDDFTDRSGAVQPLDPNPIVFPLSWMTDEQSQDECNMTVVKSKDESKRDDRDKPCSDENLRMKMLEVCEALLREVQWNGRFPSDVILKQAILNCATDLCNLIEHDTKEDEIEEWKKKMQEMLINNIIIEAMTKNCNEGEDCK